LLPRQPSLATSPPDHPDQDSGRGDGPAGNQGSERGVFHETDGSGLPLVAAGALAADSFDRGLADGAVVTTAVSVAIIFFAICRA